MNFLTKNLMFCHKIYYILTKIEIDKQKKLYYNRVKLNIRRLIAGLKHLSEVNQWLFM